MSNVVDINEINLWKLSKSLKLSLLLLIFGHHGVIHITVTRFEKVVNQKNGKVILAKINVDENQGIAHN